MACFCNELSPGQACPECLEIMGQRQIQEHLAQTTTMVLPAIAFHGGKITLEKYISDFILSLKASSPEIGHVMVVWNNTAQGNTVGIGNIAGVRDINTCVGILRKYLTTLETGIPPIN